MNIESFTVKKLHGKYDYKILFENNNLILVAENGSGKTTLVNIFYYFLSRQWSKLNDFNFESISIKINNENLPFDKKQIKDIALRESKIARRLPSKYDRILEDIIYNHDFLNNNINSSELIENLKLKYNIPSGLLFEILTIARNEELSLNKSKKIQKTEESLNNILDDVQIVYLPTYRRIEKDLKNIFPEFDDNIKDYEYRRRRNNPQKNKAPSYVELVEFGMEDVKFRIEEMCQELRVNFYNNLRKNLTGSYLEDILAKRYKDFDTEKIQNFDDEALKYILARLDDNILSRDGKKSLEKFVNTVKKSGALSDEDKINAFFVSKLFQVYEEQKKAEKNINIFVEICNDYLKSSKYFKYYNDTFEVKIHLKEDRNLSHENQTLNEYFDLFPNETKHIPTIDFRDLSSGEKQIVSLFSHLILSKKKYFIIIDEPELSLSVPWQERFLKDIYQNKECEGILAVTHSPFIFKNELIKYSHALGEFKIK